MVGTVKERKIQPSQHDRSWVQQEVSSRECVSEANRRGTETVNG